MNERVDVLGQTCPAYDAAVDSVDRAFTIFFAETWVYNEPSVSRLDEIAIHGSPKWFESLKAENNFGISALDTVKMLYSSAFFVIDQADDREPYFDWD